MPEAAGLLKAYKNLEKGGGDTKSLAGFEKFCKVLDDVEGIYWKKLVPLFKKVEDFIDEPNDAEIKMAMKFFADKAEFQKKLQPISKDFWAYLTILDKMRTGEKDKAKYGLISEVLNPLRICQVMFGDKSNNPITSDTATLKQRLTKSREAQVKKLLTSFQDEQKKAFEVFEKAELAKTKDIYGVV